MTKNARVTRGFWLKDENITRALLEAAKENGGVLSHTWLRKYKNSLACALQRSRRSLLEIGRALGFEVSGTPKGYWQQPENVLVVLRQEVSRYGVVPSNEILSANYGYGLLSAIRKFHGGMRAFAKKHKLPTSGHLSKFETCVKVWLSELIDDADFIDNGRKDLLRVGLSTKNTKTGYFLEIDRYYYNAKVAIEINGTQHYRPGLRNWCSSEVVEKTKRKDSIKKRLLKNQGVSLLVIPPSCHTKQALYNRLKKHGVQKLRKFGETPPGTIPSQARQLEGVTTSR